MIQNPRYRYYQSLSFSLCIVLFLFSCNKNHESQNISNDINEYETTIHNLLEQSSLQIPLDYPVEELQSMINRILPDTLVNDSIDLNDKGDYLVLQVLPIGNMLLNGYQGNLDASLPVSALVYIKKKVALFSIKNKKPIELKLRFDLHTSLAINEAFELATQCRIQRIHWIEEPNMNVAGVKINLKKTVEKQLEKHRKTIESAICNAIDNIVPVKKEVIAVWHLLNQTHRMAKKPVEIWLTAQPTDFRAEFSKVVTDTLRVLIYAKAGVVISPLKGIVSDKRMPLPVNQPLNGRENLKLKVSLTMPYEYMNVILNDQLAGEELTYGSLNATFNDFSTMGRDNRLFLQFKVETSGDVVLDLSATAKPMLNEAYELTFKEIDYDVLSDNPLVSSLEFLSDNSVDTYLKQHSKVSLAHILDSLDSKIIRALDRSNLGSKIDLKLNFDAIRSDTTIYFKDRFEWIFSVEGSAHAYLNDNLVE